MDTIQRFLFTDLNIRGQHLKINQAWQKLIQDRGYPEPLQSLFGQLTAITIMLANGMKDAGTVTMQIQGTGPVNLLVVEATHDLKIKGVAKTNQAITNQTTADELIGDGQIMVTMTNTLTDTHYQSFVAREGDDLITSFETFFSQSEQLPTKLWLASDNQTLAGVMVQKLPLSDGLDADGWDRISHLSNTLKKEELLDISVEELLHRLFHEENIKLFEANPIEYNCPQDTAKIETMLKSLGEAEVRKILEEQGEIVINNDICNFHARFTKEDIDKLFG